ncbi:MAG: 2,3-bisphosphoglycerate-independent phosphoglycerate mutase [Methanohalophilus sp.]
MTLTRKPLLLMILDGWGYSPTRKGNAVAQANTPVLDKLEKENPTSLLQAAGESVGLPQGQMGNSEVGHLNIGAGRIVYQDLTRINLAIKNGEIYKNRVLLDAIRNVQEKKSKLHIMGLFSHGGVHSHIEHMRALIELAKREGLSEVFIHTFLDGRDVPPRAALEDMKEHEVFCRENGIAKTASVSGRYYAMDRDKRWERTRLAYDALTLGEGITAEDPVEAVQLAYERGENDEFVKPTVIQEKGKPVATIEDNDSVIMFNFRPDRARQLTYAFVEEGFEGFERSKHPQVHYVCMTQYDEKLDVPVAYPTREIKNTLGEVLSRENMSQLRIAETEKYAHVTFFFNGGVEKKFKGEERCLIPSPRVATYDLKPEMSAYEVAEELTSRIESANYDVIILNFANMDMVGHTGFFEPTIKAVEAVDECVGKVIAKIRQKDGEALIIADHGNAEQMEEVHGDQPHTAHTSNPVKCICISERQNIKMRNGILADVAPTVLQMLAIKQPEEMTGKSLIVQNH